ncbi:MAG: type IV secretion system DNA-binding domain-containing protein [Alphaproteobacteria bacterium]|nr:type IV secretion system DNA-binding domain-containing protein [Alphaproteobacteria bacterium]
MPIILKKHMVAQRDFLRDVRPASVRIAAFMAKQESVYSVASLALVALFFGPPGMEAFMDVAMIPLYFYFRWVLKKPFSIAFKLPRYANMPDPNNPPPGKTSGGKSEGILFLGNVSDKDDDCYQQELWLTNTDARTHILYLGTTGSGKTEGLKSMVTNALAWGSGFAYTDGKADTDLWASLFSLSRRFGRDDDILVLNYMTGNSDDGSVSNSMNPFSNGSASYLANLVVNLMPDAGGDNAMWKERAVALMFALMPALTYKRDKQGVLLDVGVVRDHLELQPIIRLSRDQTLPERIVLGLKGYLNTLPGYVDAAFDDEGNERPPSPDQPMYDLQVARQQHGYLSMQFTRSMQSLSDEYGYIFKAQLADIDVMDVVLNRRILVVLIPALEKSGDEAANLGKIVASCLKGMMGATLGNTVEGAWESAIGSKQTYSNSSFMTVFDEVGYYTAAGMAVMAAQARSLGFALVFASQDLPSMEKRVKQEAKSIVGNCNLKILGRIEDPTDTKEFVTKHGGSAWVMESKGLSAPTNTVGSLFMNMPFHDDRGAAWNVRQRVDYDHLRGQREGEAHLLFGDWAYKAQMFHAVPERAKALRVHRFLPVPGVTKSTEKRDRDILELTSRLQDKTWTAATAAGDAKPTPEIAALAKTMTQAPQAGLSPVEAAAASVAALAGMPASKPVLAAQAAMPSGTRATTSSTGFDDTDDDMDASPVVNRQTVAPLPADQRAAMRAAMPPMQEGDQFAVQEIDPVNASKPVPGAYAAQASAGFAGTDADLSTIVPAALQGEDADISSVVLPDSLTAILAQSAQKLSEGLRGRSSTGKS